MCDVVYRKHFAVGDCLCAMLYTESSLQPELVHCVRCGIQKARCPSLSIVCDVVYRKHFAVGACPLCAMLYTESTLL